LAGWKAVFQADQMGRKPTIPWDYGPPKIPRQNLRIHFSGLLLDLQRKTRIEVLLFHKVIGFPFLGGLFVWKLSRVLGRLDKKPQWSAATLEIKPK